MNPRDRAVALATVRPRADCPHCNPPTKEPPMDPTATLTEIRTLTGPRIGLNPHEVNRLIELVDGLDQWLSHGGFMPTQWPAPTGLYAPPF